MIKDANIEKLMRAKKEVLEVRTYFREMYEHRSVKKFLKEFDVASSGLDKLANRIESFEGKQRSHES